MSLAGTQPVFTQLTPGAELENVVLWYNPHHLSRAWIVHHWEELPPLDSAAPEAVRRRTERVLFPQSQVRDLCHQAVVEAKLPNGPALASATHTVSSLQVRETVDQARASLCGSFGVSSDLLA